MNLLLGAAFLVAGALLFVVCLPQKDGTHRAFTRSDFARTNLPVLILSLIVMGASLLYAGLFGA